jgi:cytochrome c oxidase subunit 2
MDTSRLRRLSTSPTPAAVGAVGAVGLGAAALLALAVEPAAAQSVNKRIIGNLNRKLLYMALPVAIAVELMLFYTVYRYRKSKNPEAAPTEEDRRLEITWTVGTALVLLFVGVTASTVLANPYVSPAAPEDADTEADVPNPYLQGAVVPDDPDAVEVNVLAYQWGWEFTYPGTNVTTRDTLVIPNGTDVYLHLTSSDVIHAFYAPDLGLKQDVLPGEYNTIRTRATERGEYEIYCAEFCGSQHSHMRGTVRVVSESEYRDWLERRGEVENGAAATTNASTSAAAVATLTSPPTPGTPGGT